MATLEELQRQQQLVQQQTQQLRQRLRDLRREYDDYLETRLRREMFSEVQLAEATELHRARCAEILQLEEQRKQLEEQLAAAKQHHQS